MFKKLCEYMVSKGGVVFSKNQIGINYEFDTTPYITEVSDFFVMNVDDYRNALVSDGKMVAHWLSDGSVSVLKLRRRAMNLYLLTQNQVTGYDTYDSCVVAAESEDDAREIHPDIDVTHVSNGEYMGTFLDASGNPFEFVNYDSWPKPLDLDCIDVKLIGVSSVEKGVICASFNRS